MLQETLSWTWPLQSWEATFDSSQALCSQDLLLTFVYGKKPVVTQAPFYAFLSFTDSGKLQFRFLCLNWLLPMSPDTQQ